MTPISLKVPRRLALDLEVSEAARRRGVSRSALIREALEAFLRAERADEPVSALTMTTDLAGTLSGPADLSVNPDHMHGFGR